MSRCKKLVAESSLSMPCPACLPAVSLPKQKNRTSRSSQSVPHQPFWCERIKTALHHIMSDSSSSDASSSSEYSEDSSGPAFEIPAKTASKDTIGTEWSDSSSSSSDDDDAETADDSSSSSGESFGPEAAEDSDDDDDDDDSDDDDSDDDDDDSDDDSDDDNPKRAIKRSSSTASDEAMKPPGISEEAFKAFFTDNPIDDAEVAVPERQAAPERTKSLALESSENMVKHAEEEMNRRRDELCRSQHSLESCESMINNMSAELDDELTALTSEEEDDFKVQDISIEEESKKQRGAPRRAPSRTHSSMLRDKREMRLAKVRERLRAQEEAKEAEEDAKKMKEIEETMNGHLDMSEDARRERAYSWYTRMAMPSRAEMKERVSTMKRSSGVAEEDIDLMPWNAKGTMVNVGKMQRFINAGFKKKFTRKNSRASADSDSDSD